MASIDERIVSMAFDNAKFEAGVAQTMATLSKLDASLQKIGTTNSLGDIEKAASKVTLEQPMSALDKLKARFSRAGEGSAEGFGEISKAASKVDVTGATDQLDKVKAKTGQVGSGAADGFNEISRAANRTDVSGLTKALDTVQAKFSIVEGAAAVAFGNIASQATMRGASFAKGFGVQPILDGLHEYETNLKSIQTIQANTDRPLTEINKSLQELNKYSDQTIYNFSEMAKNIGTFTAAGVDLKTATSSIKGIANMAALSGSSSQQAATAMYQLSQAISSGRVGLQDWNSVVNAGMGGKKLQTALATTAIAMGDIGEKSVKLEGPMKKLTINGQSFRESIMAQPGQQSWLSSDILVNTLATLDGRFSKAALSAELTKDGLKKYTAAQIEAKIATSRTALEQKNGVKYTDAQFASLMKLSDSAFKSATEVKTLGQVFDVAKETIGSGWAASFQSIFGNLTEAKTTFTALSGAINGFINANALARNKVLHDWKELGGRTALIDGIKAAFQALIAILTPIRDAFRDIFPATTGAQLADFTKRFSELMQNLQPGQSTIDGIRRTFRGLFAVLHIGWSIVKETVGVIGDLLGVVGKGSGGFLNFTGAIGDFLVGIDNALTKGGMLSGFFSNLTSILKVPFALISGIAGFMGSLFGDADTGGADAFAGSMDRVNDALTPAEKLLKDVTEAWQGFKGVLSDIRTMIEPWLSQAADQISNFANLIRDAIQNADWDSVFLALQTTFIGGLFLTVKKALGGGISEIGGGFMENVNGILGGVKDQLTAMQAEVKANVILKIAAAIGILAISIGIIALIDPGRLTTAMTAIAVGLGQLMGAMALMTKMGGGLGKNTAAMPVIAASLLILAGALVILGAAMHIMARLSWEDLAKGLVGIGGALVAVAVGVRAMGPGLGRTALTLIPLAIGLNLLAFAVKQFAGMDWEDLGKGLLGVAGTLGAIALGMAALPVGQMLVVGAGLILVGIGMNLLAGAVLAFGSIPFDHLLTGLFGMASAIAAIGVSISLIPPTVALQAAGLLILAVALQGIAAAIAIMGAMDIENIIRGLTAIAGMLLIFAVGLTAMAGTLPGAAALLAAAAALALLAPALALLGNLDWGTILKGLAAIALVIGVLAVAGLIAAPGLISLGGAIAVLGLALIPAAAAVYLFAKGISLLASDGQKGVAAFMVALTGLVALLPTIVINFVKGLVSIISEIAKLAPSVIDAIGVILESVIRIVIEAAPKLAVAVGVLILSFLDVLNTNAGPLIEAGWKLLRNLLSGIENNISQVITSATNIIVKFLDGMAANIPRIIESGVNLLKQFLLGIAGKLPTVILGAAMVITKFIEGITNQLPKVISKAYDLVSTFLTSIARKIPGVISAGADILISLIEGVGNAIPRVVKSAANVVGKFINALADEAVKLVNTGFKAIINFLNGIADAIRKNDDAMIDAGANVADAIRDGLIQGLSRAGPAIIQAAKDIALAIPKKFLGILGIHSPSTVFRGIGESMMQGLTLGIEDGGASAGRSASVVANNLVDSVSGTLNSVPNILDGLVDMDPVITPVLDLSSVQRSAKQLDGLTNVTPITAAASYAQAATIAQEQQASATAQGDQAAQAGTTFQFEQNNYSPEALSDVEIYRQTKNQLSQVKSALGLVS